MAGNKELLASRSQFYFPEFDLGNVIDNTIGSFSFKNRFPENPWEIIMSSLI